MKQLQKIKLWSIQSSYLGTALTLFMASVILAWPTGAAAAQLSFRSITMSDSAVSGSTIASGVGSGLNVDYQVNFTASSTAIGGIAIDFCSNSPLEWDTCTAPAGFNANSATLTVNNQTNLGAGAFAVYTTSPLNNRVILTRATAAAPTGAVSFELGDGTTNGITNPTTTGSFYARIYTYDTAAHAQSHSQTTADFNVIDFGGVALSTANVITITARVQESMIFCVSLAAPTSNCGGVTAPAVQIGHTAGGTAIIIDSSQVDTGTAYTQISTNAVHGVIVRMHNSNSCGGLSADGGTTCSIPPAGSGAATPAAMAAGTAGFGLFVANGSGGTGTVTADADYNNGTATDYAMDSTTAGANVTTTFGDAVEACSGPVSNVNSQLTFAATASNATPAGLYAANLSMIATGTF